MEADLVGLGRPVARPFWVRTWTIVGPGSAARAQTCQQRPEVVSRHDADVGDPEILEQLARLGEVDDRLAEPPAELEHGRPDDGDALDGPVYAPLLSRQSATT